MKTIIAAFVGLILATSSTLAQCTVDPGRSGGLDRIILQLEPGVPQTFTWDFTGCTFGINAFTVYATKPRDSHGVQRELSPGTPLTMSLVNLTTETMAETVDPFVRYLGNVSLSQVQVTLLLSPSAKKDLPVEITYSANFGGAP